MRRAEEPARLSRASACSGKVDNGFSAKKCASAKYMALAAPALAILLASSGPTREQNAQPAPGPSDRAPLAIANEGSFYAGGHYDPDHPAHHIVGQVYVDYRIPQDRRHPFPIVLVHGGNQTGTGWFSTPDGRPGWAQYFLRQGYAV